MWPSETDLFYAPGSNRLALNLQPPEVRTIVHEAIKNVYAFLLFDNAFPEGADKVALIWGQLLAAAEKYKPASPHIHKRLVDDNKYMLEMIRLVRAMSRFSNGLLLNLSCCSHVSGFPCSEATRRSGVVQLSFWLLRSLVHQRQSRIPFKFKQGITDSYFRHR
jgi:hypothetical protein